VDDFIEAEMNNIQGKKAANDYGEGGEYMPEY